MAWTVIVHPGVENDLRDLGSGPVNFNEMAGEWRNYARKTVQNGLKTRLNCLTPQSVVSCLLVPESGAFRRLRCRKSLKMPAFPAPSLQCLDTWHSPKITSTISSKLTGPYPRYTGIADNNQCSGTKDCQRRAGQNWKAAFRRIGRVSTHPLRTFADCL